MRHAGRAEVVGTRGALPRAASDQEERPARRRGRQDLDMEGDRARNEAAAVERHLHLGAFEAGGRTTRCQRDRASSLAGRQHRGDDEREEQETGGHGEGRPQ